MFRFLLLRAMNGVLTLLVASIFIFVVLEVLPGDPARLMLGLDASEEALNALREQLGLNAPLISRYLHWITGLMTFDLGQSFTYAVPVRDLILDRITVSFPLALIALSLSTLIAIPVGVFAASRRGKPGDAISMGVAQMGVAVPNFWFALILVYILSVWLKVLPAGGFPGWGNGVWPALKALMLPAVALALPQAAILSRVTRSAMLDVLSEDFIRTARAKGMSRRSVLWQHAVRNALIPVLTIIGLQFSFLLAGTIIIENVFYLPGLGRLVFQAINQRDLIVVEGVVLLLVGLVVVVNLLVDLTYALVDPRLRRR